MYLLWIGVFQDGEMFTILTNQRYVNKKATLLKGGLSGQERKGFYSLLSIVCLKSLASLESIKAHLANTSSERTPSLSS